MRQKKQTQEQRLKTVEKVVSIIYTRQTEIIDRLKETPEEKQTRLKNKFEKKVN